MKSTTTNVASARARTDSWLNVRWSQPIPSRPSANPAATNTIGAVSDVPRRRCESAAKARKTPAITTRLGLSKVGSMPRSRKRVVQMLMCW